LLASAAPTRVAHEIEHGIRPLVAFLGVDRGTLLRLSEDGRSLINLYSYAVPPAEFAEERIAGVGLPWITSNLRAGRTLCFRRLDEFPREAADELRQVQGPGMRSNLTIPLAGKERCSAPWRSASWERAWPDEVIQRCSWWPGLRAPCSGRGPDDLARSREAYRDLSDKLLLAQSASGAESPASCTTTSTSDWRSSASS
jgi:hypothetical protein